jgi:hypothetical protein
MSQLWSLFIQGVPKNIRRREKNIKPKQQMVIMGRCKGYDAREPKISVMIQSREGVKG